MKLNKREARLAWLYIGCSSASTEEEVYKRMGEYDHGTKDVEPDNWDKWAEELDTEVKELEEKLNR